MAADKAKGRVTATLKRTYRYAGKSYGPGEAEIPRGLAQALRLTGDAPKGKGARDTLGGNKRGPATGKAKGVESEESKRHTAEREAAVKKAPAASSPSSK